MVVLFTLFVGRGNGAPEVMPGMDAGGEWTNPNAVRLAYMCLAYIGAFALAAGAARAGRGRGGAACFWMAAIGGILLWQSLGECAWHFGLPVRSGPAAFHAERYVMFPRLESAAGWPMFVTLAALLAYCRRRGAFSYAIWVFALSFMCNWFGHIVMIGTYPLASAFLREAAWFRASGCVSGAALAAWACFRAVKKDTGAEDARVSSLLFYTGLGIIAMGLRGG